MPRQEHRGGEDLAEEDSLSDGGNNLGLGLPLDVETVAEGVHGQGLQQYEGQDGRPGGHFTLWVRSAGGATDSLTSPAKLPNPQHAKTLYCRF